MKYYYDGCPSWKWYYPFHYGPFASDLRNIERFQKDCSSFELNEPFTPVEQLMAVLPEDSSHAIPASAKWLMSDRESPIIDFYPKDVPCDPNGKAMPWLWVVLLPFIDEDRLLSALHPTMKDWKEFELLCNTRGIDDGYIYCHVNHDISSSLVPTLDSQDKSEKLPIENCKVFGLLRRPLSNEVYPLDQVSTIHPPSSSTKIHDTMDELLTSPIETNAALCAAFTEPKKVLHKSILLGGAQPPPPVLGQSDFRIRRPRLNRGGGTIANMGGGGRGQSHQVGYGSMNIGAYERELAYKSGRGGQMNQAGTRQWGAMEPTPKRPRIQNGHGQFQSNQQHHQQYRPSFQQGNYQNSHHSQGRQNNGHRHNGMSNPQGNQYQQQSTGQRNQWHQSQPRQMPPPAHHQAQRSQQSQPRQGYNFQNYNTNRQQQQHHHSSNYNHRGGHSYSRNDQAQSQHQQQSQRSGLSSNVMSNLRSQLASTLNKNRQKGDQGGRK
jgi:5'-3' exoribonuclease 2